MNKKVIVIGGGGFIGMNLAKHLVNRGGYEITLADMNFMRDSADYFAADDLKNIDFIECDLADTVSYERFSKTYDYVYVLASVVGVNNTLGNPLSVILTNTRIILNSLEWLAKASVGRVIFSSTSEAYAGAVERFGYKIPTDELVPLTIADTADPRFTYAATKLFGESAFLNGASALGYEAVIVRYHNAFGPDMGFKHVIPHLVQRFARGEDPFLMYGAAQTRSFSFIDDTVAGTVLAAEADDSAGEVFHIGSDVEITIEALIRQTGDYMGYKGVYADADTFPGSVSRRCPDITKARDRVGYDPKVNWQDGLKVTVDWYRSYFSTNTSTWGDGFIRPGS